jgi:hypothetical protein
MPSIEEGFALVCAEAIGAGCVPLASTACTEMCRHMENALVHNVGDLSTLQRQITDVYGNPELLARLRIGALQSSAGWTWAEAGRVLVDAYERAIGSYGRAPAGHSTGFAIAGRRDSKAKPIWTTADRNHENQRGHSHI